MIWTVATTLASEQVFHEDVSATNDGIEEVDIVKHDIRSKRLVDHFQSIFTRATN